MIFVDSSVWIDYFNGTLNAETDFLDSILGSRPVGTGDLNLTEVLQGFRRDSDYKKAREALLEMTIFELLGKDRAIKAADSYRKLRKAGVTLRKTNDLIIGTYCVTDSLPLLYRDRDFEPMVKHPGLQSALVYAA